MNNTHAKKQTRIQQVETKLEKKLEQITTHPLFLKSVSKLLDLNSTRILMTRRMLHHLWQKMELPIRRDQEKTLYLIQELQFHIHKLESEIHHLRAQQEAAKKRTEPLPAKRPRPKLRFSESMKKNARAEIV